MATKNRYTRDAYGRTQTEDKVARNLVRTPLNSAPEGGSRLDAVLSIGSELLFIILPLVVVPLVVYRKQQPVMQISSSPEWTFAAAILFGQAAVKMISVAAAGAIPERASALAAAAIVVGLVPSLTVLTFVLLDEKSSMALRVPQIFLFVLAVVVYVLFAASAEYEHRHGHRQ